MLASRNVNFQIFQENVEKAEDMMKLKFRHFRNIAESNFMFSSNVLLRASMFDLELTVFLRMRPAGII